MAISNVSNILKKYIWLVSLILGALGFLVVWFLLPHKSEIDHSGQVLFKIFVFLVIVTGIAYFPNKFKNKYLLFIPIFMAVLIYLMPRLSYLGMVALPSNFDKYVGEYYTHLYLLLFPSILMITGFAYRVGGGTPGNTIKIIFSGVVIIFSGYMDILYYVINPVELPEILQYANHIKIILGHYPTLGEAIVFALCHIPILVGLMLLPLDKWLAKLQLGE